MAHNTSFTTTLDHAVACDVDGFVAAQRALRLGLEKFFGDNDVQERDRVQVLGRALFVLAVETGTVRVDRAFAGVRTLDQLLRLGAAMVAAKMRATGEKMDQLAPHFDRALRHALADFTAQRNCNQTVLLTEAAEDESSPDPADPETQEYARQVRDLAADMFAQEQAEEIRQLRAQSVQYSDRIRRLEASDAEATSRRLEEFIQYADQRIQQIPVATASLEQVAAQIDATKKLQRELAAQLRAAPNSATEVAQRIADETQALQRRLDDAVLRAQRAAEEQHARAEQRFAELERQLREGLAAAQEANDPQRLFSEQRDDLEQQMRSLRDQHANEMAAVKRQLGAARSDPAREQAMLAEVDDRIAAIERSIRQATLHVSPNTKRRIDEGETRSQMTNADVKNLQRMMQQMSKALEDRDAEAARREAEHRRAIDDIAHRQRSELADAMSQLRREMSSSAPRHHQSPSQSPASDAASTTIEQVLLRRERAESKRSESKGAFLAEELERDEDVARTLASLPATYSWHKSAKTAAAMPSLLRSVARAWNIAINGGAAAAVTALTADLQRKGKTLTLDEKERLDMLEAASSTSSTASVALAEFVGIRLDPNTKPAAWRESERTLLLARTLPASWSEAEVAEFHAGKRTLDTRCGQLNVREVSASKN